MPLVDLVRGKRQRFADAGGAVASVPPPIPAGVTPSVWDSLTPDGRLTAAERLSVQPAAPPPTAAANPPEPSWLQQHWGATAGALFPPLLLPGLLRDAARDAAQTGRHGDFSEQGGGLQAVTPGQLAVREPTDVSIVPDPRSGEGRTAAIFAAPDGASKGTPDKLVMPTYVPGRPAGWQPVSATTKTEKGLDLSPETKGAIADERKNQKEAIEATAAVAPYEVEAANRLGHYLSGKGGLDEAQQQDTQGLVDYQKRELARAAANRDRLIQDANNASVGDTHKWWSDKSLAGKFATGLGMILKGFAFGATDGKTDDPGHWIDRQVQQSLDAQKEQADLAHNKANGSINEYARLRAQFGDDLTADSAYKLKIKQNAVAQYQQAVNDTKLPYDMRLRATQALAPMLRDVAAQRAHLDDLIADKVSAVDVKAYRAATSGGMSGGVTPAKLHERTMKLEDDAAAHGINLSHVDAERRAMADLGLLVPGSAPLASYAKEPPGAKTSQKDAENMRAHENAIANIDRLIAMREKHGGGALFSPEDRAEAEAVAARTQEDLVVALGKTNQGLFDRTSHLVPDQPLEVKASGLVGSDEIGAKLRLAKTMLEEERERIKANPGAASAVVAAPEE